MVDVSDQIKDVMQDLYNIVSNKDVERLSKVLADDVILHNTDGSIIEGKEAYLKAASDVWSTIPDFTLTGEESRVVVSDSWDLGVSVGEHRSVFNESGETAGKWLHTLVWKKNDDGWKMKVFSNIALPE